jgi:hypothetical protein
MTRHLTLEMLPAREGDCLWITYGVDERRHVLIDGGRKATGKVVRKRLEELPADERLELVVVTHIDRDHIEGMLEIAESGFHGVEVKDVWFNGYDHLLNGFVAHGAVQGERLGSALADGGLPWNEAFGRGPVSIQPGAPVRLADLDGGLQLTLLSPTPAKLAALHPVWDAEIRKAGMKKGVTAEPDGPAGFERFGKPDIDALAASRGRRGSAGP